MPAVLEGIPFGVWPDAGWGISGGLTDKLIWLLSSGQLNLETYLVLVNHKRVQLTRKEYNLLRTFMENPGRVFTRNQLLERIWGIDYIGETRTVDVHIGTLRTKLGECGSYIETVRGVGYRMEGET